MAQLMKSSKFVPFLPDLIQPEDYRSDPDGRKIKLELRVTEQGLEILGDAQRPKELEELLLHLGFNDFQQMLCG